MPFLHSSSDLKIKRRSAAELLGFTVAKLFPQAYLVGGGLISYGFYYDFIFEQVVDEGMLSLIEVNLRTLIKDACPVQALSIMRENAQSLFEHHHQPFLAELAGDSEQNIIELMQLDQFYGVCPAPMIGSTDEIGSVKLLDVSTRQQEIEGESFAVTRICGTSFFYAKELKQFLKLYEVYFKRKDHRKFGVDLNLFSYSQSLSEIECLWHPKGTLVTDLLQEWLENELSKRERVEKVGTPLVVRHERMKAFPCALEPFEYKLDLYGVSPSRLLQSIRLFEALKVSLEELPVRHFEWAPIYQRKESALTEGLLDSVCQLVDQTTVFCLREQLSQEFISSLQFIEQIIRIFGFEAHWYFVASRQKTLKFRQERQTLNWMRQAVQGQSLLYPLQEELLEDDNLEGPRLELKLADGMGREWAGPALTIVTHGIDTDKGSVKAGESPKTLPAILVRQILGPLERMIALLVEQGEGIFPFWLAPEQVRILAIGEVSHSYVREIEARCKEQGLRVKVDLRTTKLGEKIHTAEKEKIPYLFIVGDQEVKRKIVTVRSIQRPGKSESVKLEEFLDQIHQECRRPTVVGC
ncbi:putative threonine-tRNA ligase [Candidatus Protochlamydia naegleriophila]|uniref:Putative threonine-tRNA ligase n=1 Tax=Candidatus Protochlamydia naegleriophila TaxID=389348 RepID=A0A0U5JD62_9BACT|nr:His/Gly/Thr/Pro-type tRNA ligase C-terminal domain-containing protein [Candidatus Protochlamydia naegleriophila]CUI17095.1 putative threonine-tRNA ligase [Candidatus Protochlamydia naegleriophila]